MTRYLFWHVDVVAIVRKDIHSHRYIFGCVRLQINQQVAERFSCDIVESLN